MKEISKGKWLILFSMIFTSVFGYSQTTNVKVMEAQTTKSKTIVLIHGLFLNNESWTEWKTYFQQKGYNVLTPSYPGHDGKPSHLRAAVRSDLANMGFEDAVTAMVKVVDSLHEKPIVIGHSMGGLIVQKLVEMDKVAAGISIDGAAPKNVMAPLSTLKIVWPALNLFKGKSPFTGSKDWYHKAFFNTFSKEESDKLYDEFAVPESRKIVRESALRSFAKIDFKKPHQPLLFIAGEKDAIFSPAFTKKIANKYEDKNSVVGYKVFENRTHFICGQENWREVGEYIDKWISAVSQVSR